MSNEPKTLHEAFSDVRRAFSKLGRELMLAARRSHLANYVAFKRRQMRRRR